MKLELKRKIAAFLRRNKPYYRKKNNNEERSKQRRINKTRRKFSVSKLTLS
jgi:hypothetical protein